jgi:hypothetical protein
MLMGALSDRKMAFYMLQKKYGLQRAGGERTERWVPLFGQGGGAKQGRKRNAPDAAKGGKKTGKKMKGEGDQECEGEAANEVKKRPGNAVGYS